MRARRWGACPSVWSLTHEARRLGSTVEMLKLKGIDGGPHKRWSMWFNSKQREEPYLGLKISRSGAKSPFPARHCWLGAAWLSSARVNSDAAPNQQSLAGKGDSAPDLLIFKPR